MRHYRPDAREVHGADDRYVPASNAYALAQAIPGAKLLVFYDAGHLVFIERAEGVNEEVVSFLLLEPRGLGRSRATSATVPDMEEGQASAVLLRDRLGH